jgi:hypothetical protein
MGIKRINNLPRDAPAAAVGYCRLPTTDRRTDRLQMRFRRKQKTIKIGSPRRSNVEIFIFVLSVYMFLIVRAHTIHTRHVDDGCAAKAVPDSCCNHCCLLMCIITIRIDPMRRPEKIPK